MHKTYYSIYACAVVELYSFKDAYSIIVETASLYVRVESGVSIQVHTMVNTVNICRVICTLSVTDDSVNNFEALCCCAGCNGFSVKKASILKQSFAKKVAACKQDGTTKKVHG